MAVPSTKTLPLQSFQSKEWFYKQHVHRNKPALFSDAAVHWPGLSVWQDKEYLYHTVGKELVPISLGGCEETTAGNRKSRKITLPFDQFLKALNDGTCTGYLKQYDLAASSVLRADVRPEIMFDKWNYGICNLWVGSEGSSKTGLHNDDENNVLCQISGQKHVVLIAPDEREHLYVNNLYDSGTECCDVNAEAPNLDVHPAFQKVTQIYSVTLNPGDVLFIPQFWYHQVRPCGKFSMSINYFNSSPSELVQYGVSRCFFWVLHWMGLYKKGQCVCHDD